MKKRRAAAAAAILMMLAAVGCRADDEGAVVQSACSIVPSGDYYMVHCFAQIENRTENIICLDRGSFELHNGEQLLAVHDVSTIHPYFILPGQNGYINEIVAFEPDENGRPVIPQVTGIVFGVEYMQVDNAFAGYDLGIEASVQTDADNRTWIVCRIDNPYEEPAYEPSVAYGVYTQSGAMIYAGGDTLEGVGIPAGGSILTRFRLDDLFIEQWSSYGVAPNEVKATASYRDDRD